MSLSNQTFGVVSVVFEPFETPFRGVWVIGFVLEDSERNWRYVQCPTRRGVALPTKTPDSITEYVLRQGVTPE